MTFKGYFGYVTFAVVLVSLFIMSLVQAYHMFCVC